MKLYITEELGIISTGTGYTTTAKIFHAINRGIQNTCQDFPALEKLDTLFVSKAPEGVALPSDLVRLKAAWRLLGDTVRIPLDLVDPDTIIAELSTKAGVYHDKGSIFSPKYNHTFAGRLMFSPKYSRTDSMSVLIYYYARDTWKTAADSSTVVAQEYREKIIYFALSLLWAQRGRMDLSSFYKSLYMEGLPPKTREDEGKK